MGYFAINQSDEPETIDILINRGYRSALKKVGCNGRYMLDINTVKYGEGVTTAFRLEHPWAKLKRMPDAKYPRGGDHDFTEPAVVTSMLREAIGEAFNFYGYSNFVSEGLQKGLIDTMYKREDYLINQYLPQWNGLNIEPYRIEMALNLTIYHINYHDDGSITVIYDCFPGPELTAVRDPNPPVSLEMLFG
jgi:hypothetical protein